MQAFRKGGMGFGGDEKETGGGSESEKGWGFTWNLDYYSVIAKQTFHHWKS